MNESDKIRVQSFEQFWINHIANDSNLSFELKKQTVKEFIVYCEMTAIWDKVGQRYYRAKQWLNHQL